jgi:hypothetical protein
VICIIIIIIVVVVIMIIQKLNPPLAFGAAEFGGLFGC